MITARFSKTHGPARLHPRLPLLVLAIAIAAGTAGFAAHAQQSPLPPISAPGQIGPRPPVGSGGCSIAAPTCADVAPTIVQNALGPSPLAQDVARLAKILRASGADSAAVRQAGAWAVDAFRGAGVDQARLESYPQSGPARWAISSRAGQALPVQNVVAGIRGRDAAGGYVILAARLDSAPTRAGALAAACNVALIVAAARAVHAAGALPLRSIRFVLFGGAGRWPQGARAYIQKHRGELGSADAVIVDDAGTQAVTGYDLEGRPSLETALRKDLAPAAPLGALHDSLAAKVRGPAFDFLLEGVPTIAADTRAGSHSTSRIDVSVLQHNAAVLALTAYAIADAPGRLGQRQSRPQVQRLLERAGLERQMKQAGIWAEWERGELGRK